LLRRLFVTISSLLLEFVYRCIVWDELPFHLSFTTCVELILRQLLRRKLDTCSGRLLNEAEGEQQ
jgi:hypothetical protein